LVFSPHDSISKITIKFNNEKFCSIFLLPLFANYNLIPIFKIFNFYLIQSVFAICSVSKAVILSLPKFYLKTKPRRQQLSQHTSSIASKRIGNSDSMDTRTCRYTRQRNG